MSEIKGSSIVHVIARKLDLVVPCWKVVPTGAYYHGSVMTGGGSVAVQDCIDSISSVTQNVRQTNKIDTKETLRRIIMKFGSVKDCIAQRKSFDLNNVRLWWLVEMLPRQKNGDLCAEL